MKLKGFPYAKGRRAAILVHRQADVDAIASIIGLVKILKEKGFLVSVPEPAGVSSLAKSFMEKVGFAFSGSLRGADIIIIADTGSPKLLEGYLKIVKKSKAFKILVDHHPPDPSYDFIDAEVLDVKASSTSEIVYRIAERNGIKLDEKTAVALLAGILFDSQHLSLANCRTLEVVQRLCRIVGGLAKAKALLVHKKEISEVIARLKAGQRAKIFRARDMIFVFSRLSSFQSSAAKFFIDAGADFAAVLGETEEGGRGSLRCSKKFLEKTCLHLGMDIARKIVEVYEGTGGGHPTAASFKAEARVEDLEEELKKLIEEKVGKMEELKR